MKPDIEKIVNCIDKMAEAMNMKTLPLDRCKALINHVLYDEQYDDVKGKEGWACFQDGLITEREIRNLLMAHSATKISKFNKEDEPNSNEYAFTDLCQAFDAALLGKPADLNKTEGV